MFVIIYVYTKFNKNIVDMFWTIWYVYCGS
jgi:hypothetical protein